MELGVGVGLTTARPPLSVEVPEPAPHADMERTVARAIELWLKVRTPNFPFKHCLKGVCQELDKDYLPNMVNDFPSTRHLERRPGAATGTIPPVHTLRRAAQI